ncbi:DNA-binding response regulator, OmpR family, contains REC and winged-helix (wHTH) domain [Ekhidna lutea]|uniref:DNA-binding response regulator, OmpR family, contains REC and winged-helix (WHTH) domain n=1 Tax=Ekhidna lutea TaxID=447679 RepID=A0A239HQ38_EKHLU|nr:response regulator transcription factor [Ekhidna lutea]SNS83452.1 DNA-binding response regulator, OmpR family, contains REC and winged-helix (wHTH) domain [Ekhidna lutea]
MNRILLVEDDANLGYILKEYLQMNDLIVEWVKDGEEGMKVFESSKFDLCILDIMMPKKDGFEVAHEIKAKSPEIPLIFLTAKSLKIDKLKGFKAGCDDYIVKPVDEEELIARIHAVLRRSNNLREVKQQYNIGSFHFDPKIQKLEREGKSIHLTQKESRVLHMLCISYGELVESDHILKELWGQNDYFKRRSMDVFISKIRKYLSVDSSVQITNVHGKGYILEG